MTATAANPESKALSVREYLDALVTIIRSPAGFFSSLTDTAGLRKPTMFLFISALFYSTVSMSYFYENSLTMGIVYLINAIAMPFLAAIFSFTLSGMIPGGKANFNRIFTVYAYASGAIMVVSWIPALGIILELFRAIIVTVGLKKACGMGWLKACTVVAGTAMLLLVFFWTLAPVLMRIKELFLS